MIKAFDTFLFYWMMFGFFGLGGLIVLAVLLLHGRINRLYDPIYGEDQFAGFKYLPYFRFARCFFYLTAIAFPFWARRFFRVAARAGAHPESDFRARAPRWLIWIAWIPFTHAFLTSLFLAVFWVLLKLGLLEK